MSQSTYGGLEVFGHSYVSHRPQDLAREMMERRQERLRLTWRILNRTYDDYLIKPESMPEAVWDPLKKRFTITDLASPVLSTINSATYGGRVTRRIRKAWSLEKLEDFMAESRYESFVPVMHRYATAYGTSYAAVGRKNRAGKTVASLAHLHPVLTEIVVPTTDVEYVQAVTCNYGDVRIKYAADGTFEGESLASGGFGEAVRLENSGYGFIPVTIGRFRWMDPSTPYGQDGIWPAVEETKQVTALMCDLMVLERNQSYSTMVISGALMENPQDMKFGPWVVLRGDTSDGQEFDAKWISPAAKIAEINDIIESKFERAATQCQVPIELFTRSKSGVNQSAGAALLQHKPLFDLVIEQQRAWREVEFDLMARISAFLEFEQTREEVDLDKHREMLDVDIEFEHETHPSYNQGDVQTWMMMRDIGVKTQEQAIENFNRVANVEEIKAQLMREYEQREEERLALSESRLAVRGDGGEGVGAGSVRPGEIPKIEVTRGKLNEENKRG